MLEDWLREAAAEGGVVLEGDLASDDAVTAILDLARDAAHHVERPAAPLAAFAAGLALGRAGGGLTELRDVAARIGSLAGEWADRH